MKNANKLERRGLVSHNSRYTFTIFLLLLTILALIFWPKEHLTLDLYFFGLLVLLHFIYLIVASFRNTLLLEIDDKYLTVPGLDSFSRFYPWRYSTKIDLSLIRSIRIKTIYEGNYPIAFCLEGGKIEKMTIRETELDIVIEFLKSNLPSTEIMMMQVGNKPDITISKNNH